MTFSKHYNLDHIIVMALSMVAVNTALRADRPAEQPAPVQTYLRADYCMACHYPRGGKGKALAALGIKGVKLPAVAGEKSL